jgi:hypothetical protein
MVLQVNWKDGSEGLDLDSWNKVYVFESPSKKTRLITQSSIIDMFDGYGIYYRFQERDIKPEETSQNFAKDFIFQIHGIQQKNMKS